MKKKKNSLDQIKYVGPARLKLLKKNGIASIVELDKTPVEVLAKINKIGKSTAHRLKKEAAAHIEAHPPRLPKPKKIKKPLGTPEEQRLLKSLKKLNKRVNQANEKLKPLWEKKYLVPYIELKKRSKKLRRQVKPILKKPGVLKSSEQEKVIKKADALSQMLLEKGKKPRMKAYKIITTEMRSFTGMIKENKT